MGFVVSANVLNLILDVVLIRDFGMGYEGAALATLVSYIVVFIVMLFKPAALAGVYVRRRVCREYGQPERRTGADVCVPVS